MVVATNRAGKVEAVGEVIPRAKFCQKFTFILPDADIGRVPVPKPASKKNAETVISQAGAVPAKSLLI